MFSSCLHTQSHHIVHASQYRKHNICAEERVCVRNLRNGSNSGCVDNRTNSCVDPLSRVFLSQIKSIRQRKSVTCKQALVRYCVLALFLGRHSSQHRIRLRKEMNTFSTTYGLQEARCEITIGRLANFLRLTISRCRSAKSLLD